ncbi:MAG TPA: hypothetical protein VFW56_07015 [Bradyrhizobium sp.]|jgi:hypothetical protein|nr:hypothetical protein [Bradyrhizobium sp.]
MADIASIASSVTSAISRQTADLGKAADATKKSFAETLSKVETTVGLKPKTGFTAGPTYEASTLTGQTKAALNNAVNTVKSALHIPH